MRVRFVVPTSRSTAPLFRDAKRSTDLDQFTARYDDFAAFGQRIQREEDRRRVVVDHQRTLGAHQSREQPLGMGVTFTSLARLQVVFEVRVLGRDFGEVLDGLARQRRSSQVGMQDDTSRVDDGPQ
jgi:hypothetical protein